ncbi:hypothetical protein [Gloeobacter violaceus]|nr:hypothetical protein [Gloeobacter violaceus]
MKRWFLTALLVATVALPVRADIRSELVQTLTQAREALASKPGYAQYLQEAGRVTSALDRVIYSRTPVPANALSAVKFVNKQMRALEEAWALRYRIGLKNLDAPDVVGFAATSLPRVRKAFAAVDPKLRIDDYIVGRGRQNNAEEYVTFAYDRLVQEGFEAIAKNLDTALARLK